VYFDYIGSTAKKTKNKKQNKTKRRKQTKTKKTKDPENIEHCLVLDVKECACISGICNL